MSRLLAIFRFSTLITFSMVSALVIFVGQLSLSPFPGRRQQFRRWMMQTWGSRFCHIAGIELEVEGSSPEAPFFLVCNHQGYLDIPVLAATANIAFIAKSELRKWPLIGLLIASADTLFLDRGNKRDILRVLDRIDRLFARGVGILLFPEGTTGPGDQLLPFKPSLLRYPADRGFPVHYATITYDTLDPDRPARDFMSWWAKAPFLPHAFRMLQLPKTRIVIRFGREPVHAPDRKVLAQGLRTAMEAQFQPSG